MPTYGFKCPDGHEFERFFRSMSGAATELACPTCGRVAARQMSGGAGLVFKGSGFYITDYGKDGKKDHRTAASKGGESKGGESKGGESKGGESKGAESKGAEAKSDAGSKSGGEGASTSSDKGSTSAAPSPAPRDKPSSSGGGDA